MRKFETSAVLEGEIFNDATHRSLYESLDEQKRFNRHYYGWTAAILAAVVLGGGGLLCYWISTLPY